MVLNPTNSKDSGPTFKSIGTILLCVIPVAGLAALAGLVALKQYSFAELSTYLAIPMVLAPLAYFFYSKRSGRDLSLSDGLFKVFLSIYLLLFAASVILLAIYDVRPIAYYVLLMALAAIVLLEITLFQLSERKTLAILLQIMAFALNIIWGINLKYYFFVGRTDSIAHPWYAANLIQSGYVSAVFDDYTAFPLWQILFSTVHLITGSTAQIFDTMFVTSGLIYLLIPLAIFYVAFKITDDRRISTLSALIVSFYPYYVILGSQSLSRSVTSCLAVILVMLLLDAGDLKKRALALFLTVAIIIYHPVAIVFITIILFLIYVLQKLFVKKQENKILSLKYFIFTTAGVIVYWLINANELIQKLLYNMNTSAPASFVPKSITSMPLNELFNYLQYLPLLFFIIVGVIFVLRTRLFDEKFKIFMLVALLLIPVTFPGPMYLVSKLAQNFDIERFYENGFLFMSIAAAAGFMALFYKSGKYMRTGLVLIFCAMVLLSVSNDFVSSDNPLIKRPFFTYYLTAEEVAGINHDQNVTVGYLMSDYVPTRYVYFSPNRSQFYLTEVDENNKTFFRVGPNDTLLIRQGELINRPLDLYSLSGNDLITPHRDFGDYVYPFEYYNSDSPLWNDLKRFDIIYDSNTVDIYNPPH